MQLNFSLSVLVFSFFSLSASAQWSGTNPLTTSSNVGIGIATPISKLQVNTGYTTDCNTYSGQPALRMVWTTPNINCTFPGPSGTPPNIMEIVSPDPAPPYQEYPHFIIIANGIIGIKTTPYLSNVLTVNGATRFVGNSSIVGNVSLERAVDNAYREINANSALKGLYINANTGSTNGPSIEMYSKDNTITDRKGAIRLVSYGSTGEGTAFLNYDPSASTWRRTMTVTNDNKVYIGDVKPSGAFADYRLGVDGSIVAKRCVIQMTDWADFVFKPDYELMPLSEVEAFIKENNHLPDIPEEKAILENGMDVSEMNKLLLQKIEELTLYMIELKKENELIKAKLDEK